VVVFLVGAVIGAVGLSRGWHIDEDTASTRLKKWLTLTAAALSVLNLALLAGLVALALGLANQWRPGYPLVLNWLPLVGSFSACLTLVFLAILIARWRALPASRLSTIGWGLFAACVVAFVPFLLYWGLLGLVLS